MGIDNLEIQEFNSLINLISEYGQDPKGGISRLLYTKEWVDTQAALKVLMKNKNFNVYCDEVGNLFGRVEGSKYKDETILTGSHIDSVVNGGKFDGQLGIIGGILAIEYLRQNFGQPLRNIEVVAMAEEEGSRFPFTFWGSKNIVGTVKRESVEDLKDIKDIGFIEAMHGSGYDFKKIGNQGRNDLKTFIELHVEQGGVLEYEKKSIGIVQHIVGQRRFNIEVDGQANHAGTTPMGYRKDALHATSRIIQSIMDRAIEYGDPLVATVGRIEVEPNTVNVVPAKTTFSLDVRHVSKSYLENFTTDVYQIINRVSREMSVGITIDMYMNADPVTMSVELVDIIKNQCEKRGLNYKLMHSGAGHDAQIFAEHIPTALIFVPSHKGISHSPFEHTEPEDILEGIKALIETLYYLAYK